MPDIIRKKGKILINVFFCSGGALCCRPGAVKRAEFATPCDTSWLAELSQWNLCHYANQVIIRISEEANPQIMIFHFGRNLGFTFKRYILAL